jgi:hypothetical protein
MLYMNSSSVLRFSSYAFCIYYHYPDPIPHGKSFVVAHGNAHTSNEVTGKLFAMSVFDTQPKNPKK